MIEYRPAYTPEYCIENLPSDTNVSALFSAENKEKITVKYMDDDDRKLRYYYFIYKKDGILKLWNGVGTYEGLKIPSLMKHFASEHEVLYEKQMSN